MKLYINNEQTAKLIELGFEKPEGSHSYWRGNGLIINTNYSIGELIEMLPESASQRLRYVATKRAWIVDVDMLGKQGKCHRGIYYAELVDALYDMVIKLKEEGVI